jgi:hypothetical protein
MNTRKTTNTSDSEELSAKLMTPRSRLHELNSAHAKFAAA